MTDWVQIISTVGFPIFSFLVCGAGLKYCYDKSNELQVEAMSKIADLADAVSENTKTLAILVEKVGN